MSKNPRLGVWFAAAAMVFFTRALLFSTWQSRSPEVQDALNLNTAEMGLLVMVFPAGGLLGIFFANALMNRFGAGKLTIVGFSLGALSLFGLGVAVSAGNVPTAFSITTGTTSGTERMRITSAGLMGIGTGTPASCAIVDVTSTTLGFKFPVMTTTQKNAIGTPVAGLVIFDSTLAKLCVYSGSAWQTITSV